MHLGAGDEVWAVGRQLVGRAPAPPRGERARREPERRDERGNRSALRTGRPPQPEAVLGARTQAAEIARVQIGDRPGGGGAKRITEGGVAVATAATRDAIPATTEATEAYRVARNAISQTTPAVSATQIATPKKTPPQVATILPPFAKRRKSGRQ